MSNEFNVFNEFGNFVGKVKTYDTVGFELSLALYFLLGAAFLVYLPFLLAYKGFKAAQGGDIKRALKFWIIPTYVTIWLTLYLLRCQFINC